LPARLDVLMPAPLTGRGPSYTCGMISRSLGDAELDLTVVTPHARGYSVAPARIHEVLPWWTRYLPYRLIRSLAEPQIETGFLSHALQDQSAAQGAYIWPDTSVQLVKQLRRAGIKVFREMVNCHRGTAKVILDDAYARLRLPAQHGISQASVEAEQAFLEAVDGVFCPNACVEASLLRTGLSRDKIMPASYGWDPARLAGTSKLLAPYDGITVVFVGTICVRKGVHLLLDYWASSKVRGRLVLAGAMEAALRETFAAQLARDDVIVHDYISDIGALYRSADVFAFPSLEEGGPQVIYEACGCGLPVITTPMGAGRIALHGREGFVLDPYDREGWISALRTLAEDKDQRLAMAAAARARAKLFRWEAVARRRRHQILERLGATRKVIGKSSADRSGAARSAADEASEGTVGAGRSREISRVVRLRD
jgi:glycosyltransferase involved in cell wall biosynthesis